MATLISESDSLTFVLILCGHNVTLAYWQAKNLMKYFVASILIFLMMNTRDAIAQGRVTGRVQDAGGEPIPLAHVLLYQDDETERFLQGVATDSSGTFDLQHSVTGSLFIVVQALGFREYRSQVFGPNLHIDLGKIILETQAEQLDAVTVTADRPLFEQKMDRTIVNVQSGITNLGDNVLNVLSKSPAVRVNRSTGEISMMGKNGVVVMIDNKPVRLEPADLLGLLQHMAASNVETIELITAPPADYDAQGNAGIININTVRGTEGFSGQLSANAGYGRRPKLGAAINLDHQKGKIALHANLSSSIAYDLEKVSIGTRSPASPESHLHVIRKPRTSLHAVDLSADYQLGSGTFIGAMVTGYISDWVMDSQSETTLAANDQQRTFTTTSFEKNRLDRIVTNLNAQHAFSPRSRVSVDLDRIQFTRDNPTRYYVYSADGDSSSEFFSRARTPVTVHVLKSDFRYETSETLTIETGIKASLSSFENHVNVAFEQDGSLVDDPAFTDVFSMDERIYAGYASADWKPKPVFTLKAGLRYEYYHLDLTSEDNGVVSRRRQGNIFPSIHFAWQLPNHREFAMSYVNRIQRPGFLILAPYFYFFDQNTLFTGNPAILPSRSNQIQLGYRAPSFSVQLMYSRETMPVFDAQPTADRYRNTFIVQPVQGEFNNVLSVNTSYTVEITPWWSARANVLTSVLHQRLNVDDVVFDKSMLNCEITTTHNWHVGKIAEVEVSGAFYSPLYVGTVRTAARNQIDIGIRRKLRSGMSLSFNVTDVFNSGTQWPTGADVPNASLYYRFHFDAEGPVFRFNVSMPIGNQNVKQRDKWSGGSEEEQRRLN